MQVLTKIKNPTITGDANNEIMGPTGPPYVLKKFYLLLNIESGKKWFLFGAHPYQPTLDFAFFILEWTIVKRMWFIIKKKSFQTIHIREAIKL